MNGYIELKLWLHRKKGQVGRTYFKDEFFFTALFPQEEGRSACEDLRGREAVFILIGKDPTLAKPLLFAAAGEVSGLAKSLIPQDKHALFSKLYLLGAPDARRYLPVLMRSLRKSGEFILLNDSVVEAEDEELPSEWSLLSLAAGAELPWLARSSGKKEEPHTFKYGIELECTGRGARAKAVFEKGGIRILAGSRSSPMDATTGLIQPMREKIKTLVDDGSLVKRDGVWTFVRDVRMASAVLAASILMRSSASASHWVTDEGKTLSELIASR